MNTVSPEQAGLSSQRLRRIDKAMRRYIDENKLAGIQATIARRGGIAYHKNFGMLDIETGTPVQDDSLFRIYSMSKPITSVAAMMLYEEGHFHLTDPVSRFIPTFAYAKVLTKATESGLELAHLERPIEIWHLLTHTSGLSYGWDDNSVDKLYREYRGSIADPTLAEFALGLAGLPLLYQPGTAWRYSLATDVLGYLVQVVSGMPFEDFVRTRIFEPLGMVDTAFWVPEDKRDRFGPVYTPENMDTENKGLKALDGPYVDRYDHKPKFPSGGGGLVSTTADYLRFAEMIFNKGELDGVRLLGKKTVELMTIDHLEAHNLTTDKPTRGFGLGFGIWTSEPMRKALGSEGSYTWGGAANTHFWIDPQEELIGLLMLQYIPAHTYPVVDDFVAATYQALID